MADVPIIFILLGIVAYTVLAGADFGAGFWTLLPFGGRVPAAQTRDHVRHAMGPVWEANHVWLIFILVVCWTCYPVAFGSIMSTLSIPLFIAAIGIIFRGTAYALRSQLDVGGPGVRLVEFAFALSSVLTPFAFGTVIGGIATGRVPVGNARGDLITSWLNPVSILTGVLAIAFSAYLSAVYLAADASHLSERSVLLDFRDRALATGVVAGGLALAGLFVIRSSAGGLWHGLAHGAGLALVIVCAAAGVVTMVLVWLGRFGLARASAALAVAAVIAGWAAAQEPRFLPGMTVAQAAAGRSTLLAIIISVGAGAVVLVPSLILLFTLFLRGHLDTGTAAPDSAVDVSTADASAIDVGAADASAADASAADASAADASAAGPAGAHRTGLAGAFAVVTLVAGAALLVFANPAWAHAVGALCLVACAVTVFGLTATPAEQET
jgi:cytochrome bd ubiquinol oxidase subunit II